MNTIHIFGYGEAQIIGKDLNFKTDVANFKKLQAVIDDIKSKRPTDIDDLPYHSINIFNDLRADYASKEIKKGRFSVEFKKLDSKKLNALIAEFASLKESEKAK